MISSFIEGDPGDYHKNQPFRELDLIDDIGKTKKVYYKWCKNGLKRVKVKKKDKDTEIDGYLIIDN